MIAVHSSTVLVLRESIGINSSTVFVRWEAQMVLDTGGDDEEDGLAVACPGSIFRTWVRFLCGVSEWKLLTVGARKMD